jgi:SH3-like domain-containing protein
VRDRESIRRVRPETDHAAAVLRFVPAGAAVTLTREGAENGNVTVDYDGTLGWAYADLLGEPAN